MQIAEIFVKLALDSKNYADGLARAGKQAADFANQANGAANHAVGAFGRIGGAIGDMAKIAGGIIAADLFGKITGGIKSLAMVGFDAVNTAQKMEMSFKSLAVQGLMYDQVTQTTTQAITEQLMTQDEYGQKLDELTSKLETQKATYQEQAEQIRQMTEVWTDEGLNVKKLKAQHEQLAVSIRGTEQDIAGLSTSQTTYADVTKTSWQQVMDLENAQKLASEQSKQLLVDTERLAAISPFEQDQVQMVAKYGLQAGLSADKTMQFTKSFLDLAAGAGVASGDLGYTAYQFTQLAQKANISAIDIRELATRGIDLNKIIGTQLGMSVDEFNQKLKKNPEEINKLFDAVQTYADKTFPGVSQTFATSIEGMTSTAKDLGKGIARRLFTPLVDAVSPYISDALSILTDTVFGSTTFEDAGKWAADSLMKGFSELNKIVNVFKGGGFKIGVQYLLKQLGFNQGTIGTISKWTEKAQNAISAFQKGGLFGTGKEGGLLAALGLSPELVQTIQSIVGTITTDIKLLWAAFTGGDSGAIGQVGAFIGQQLQDAWTNYIQPQLTIWGGQFMNWVGTVYANIPTALTGLITSISDFLTEYWPTISATLFEWSTKFWEWTTQAALGVGVAMAAIATALLAWAMSPEAQEATSGLGANIGKMIVDGIKLLFQGTEGTGSVLASLASGLIVGIAGITGSLIIFGGELVAGIVSGILASLGVDLQPTTFSELSKILTGIGNDIVTIAKYIGNQIVTGIQNGWNATVGTITELFTTGVESWTAIITETDWLEIGMGIVDGIEKGITENMNKVLEMMKELAKMALNSAKRALGIGSPSKEFAVIGGNIIQGLMTGIDTNTSAFNKKLSSSLQHAISLSSNLVQQQVEGRQRIRNLFTSWVGQSQGNLSNLTGEQVKASIAQYAQAWGGNAKYTIDQMIKQGYDFGKLATKMRDAYNDFMLTLRLENIAGSLGTVSAFTTFEQAMVDRLNGRIEALQAIVDEGGGEYLGQIYSQVEAQDALNSALQEQLTVQEQITALAKQQSDLEFLQQQVNLLQLVQDKGLNISDIFSGITFGLDASIPDLINATSNVVNAMIGQINKDLQIASPSKVMAQIGEYMNQGLAKGLGDSMSLPVGAMGGAAQSIVNKSFTQNIYSNTGPGNAIGQFQMMSASFST